MLNFKKKNISRSRNQSFNKFESIVCDYLSANKIIFFKAKYTYKKNKWFEIDIFLPDYNLAIECQGPRHFNKVTPNRIFLDNLKKYIFKNKLFCLDYRVRDKLNVVKYFLQNIVV